MAINANAQAWIAALRSGEYTQGHGALSVNNKFCCLGVACDLYIKAHPNKAKWVPDNYASERSTIHISEVYDDYGAELAPEVQEWLGLSTVDGCYYEDNLATTSLIWHNDKNKDSFERIADIIASEPRGLFNTQDMED